jgi:hypothetical protein
MTDTPGWANGESFPAPAIDIVWPLDWGGEWSGQIRNYICGTTPPAWTPDLETICGGTYIDVDDSPEGYSCTVGELTSTSIDITCEYTEEIFPDCSRTTTVELDYNRTGDSATGTVVITTIHEGTGVECAALGTSCFQQDIQSNRTGPEPGDCVAAVSPVTWGHVKSVYE